MIQTDYVRNALLIPTLRVPHTLLELATNILPVVSSIHWSCTPLSSGVTTNAEFVPICQCSFYFSSFTSTSKRDLTLFDQAAAKDAKEYMDTVPRSNTMIYWADVSV
jgi:hypothetical protein